MTLYKADRTSLSTHSSSRDLWKSFIMLTRFLILSCAYTVALALGDGQYYASKTSKKSPQPFASTKTHQPAPIHQQQYNAPEQFSGMVYQQPQQEYMAVPAPYSFNYEADGSARQESRDGSGKVTGSYTVVNEDGSKRLVKYIADEQGFRAQIDTDEPGTKSDNPANIQLKSAAKAPEFQAQQKKYQPQISQQPIMQYKQDDYASQQPIMQYKQDNYASQQPIMQYKQNDYANQKPAPYSFSYASQMDDGSSSRSEHADGSGKVAGTYSMSNIDGRQRTVDYTADDAGFKASVDTNEFGTKSESPADIKFFSSAPVDQASAVAPKAPLSFPAPRPQTSSAGGSYYSSYSAQDQEEQYGPASPYEFNYVAQLDDGSSSRSESSDGAGTITGSYNLAVADGRQRSVEYTADHGGFRANVKTNEFGTKSDSPADVMLYSTATDEEPAPYKSPASSYQPASPYQATRQSYQVPVAQQAVLKSGTFPSSYQPQPQRPVQFSQAPLASSDLGPAPYAFDYKSQSDEGSSARSESADASGKVTGTYSLTHMDGSQRTVQYTADKDGFKAKVLTNEFGTTSDSPADAAFQSTAPLSAPSVPSQYSMGSTWVKAKPALQSSTFHSGAKFEGQQRIQTAPATATFKAPSTPYAAKQQPFQIVQQKIQEPQQYAPSPYAFNYNAEGSARQESSDNNGKVTGSYSVTNEDGSMRIVEYIADQDGFRANVKTDEPGTKSDNPANVILLSSAPEPKPYSASETKPYSAPEPKPYSAPEPKPYSAPEPKPYSAPEPKPYSAPEPKPYSAPQHQYQQPGLRSQFPAQTYSKKSSMISQEKIY